jgi:AcrR family transcriptional regulator
MAVVSKKIVKVNGRNRRPWALASKERILEAATAEIAAVGFERARLTEIAARAEMTPGSIYTWFENKEDLFRAALEEALTKQIISNAEALDAEDFTDNWILQLGTLVPRNSRDTKATDAQMLLIESYYAAWRDPKARKKFIKGINSHLEMYVNIIKNAQAAGKIHPDLDSQSVGTIILAMQTGMSLLSLAGVPRVEDKHWTNILTHLYYALKPTKS